jgi:hypothetical protein
MEQAGIDKIRLIENKEVTKLYQEDGITVVIDSGGNVFNYDSHFPFTLQIQEAKNLNGKLGFEYILGFTELDPLTIQKIRRSIYGFMLVCFFSTGENKIITLPLNWDKGKQNNNISASYSVVISNFVTSQKAFEPFFDSGNVGIPWILDTGFWDDDAYWVDSAVWID